TAREHQPRCIEFRVVVSRQKSVCSARARKWPPPPGTRPPNRRRETRALPGQWHPHPPTRELQGWPAERPPGSARLCPAGCGSWLRPPRLRLPPAPGGRTISRKWETGVPSLLAFHPVRHAPRREVARDGLHQLSGQELAQFLL